MMRKGSKHTEEAKRKVSEANKGRLAGRPITAEHRQKIAKARKGQRLSEEHKQKISQSKKGQPHCSYTPGKSTKLKISTSLKKFYKKNGTHWTGRKHSETSKRKMSEIKKGKQLSEEHKRKIRLNYKGTKGYKHTDEAKRKMSETRKKMGDTNPMKRPEVREKIRQARLGKKMSLESRLKLSKALKGRPGLQRNGKANPFYGRKHSSKTKAKMSKSSKGQIPWAKGKFGPDSPAWKGGKSFEPYSSDWTNTLKKAIRERDNYRCQMCNLHQKNPPLDVHHLDYDKENCNPENLVTLCKPCHSKTNHNRKFWIKFFKSNVKLRIVTGGK